MALIPCYECGAEISDMGKSCPKCGAPAEMTIQQLEIDRIRNLIHDINSKPRRTLSKKKIKPENLAECFPVWSRILLTFAIIMAISGYINQQNTEILIRELDNCEDRHGEYTILHPQNHPCADDHDARWDSTAGWDYSDSYYTAMWCSIIALLRGGLEFRYWKKIEKKI